MTSNSKSMYLKKGEIELHKEIKYSSISRNADLSCIIEVDSTASVFFLIKRWRFWHDFYFKPTVDFNADAYFCFLKEEKASKSFNS